MPVKVATAPISVRARVSSAISAPMSKSSRCRRTVNSASGHRREERDLARTGDDGIRLHMRAVDCGADHLGVLERVGVLLAASGKPRDEFTDRAHASRRIDLLFRLADALAHPGEVEHLQDISPQSNAARPRGNNPTRYIASAAPRARAASARSGS